MRRVAMCIGVVVVVACGVAEAGHYHYNTQWSKLKVGMDGWQVKGLLGQCTRDYQLSADTWVQVWEYTDRCQGFGQELLFHVWYGVQGGRWLMRKKDVDWMSERWFRGSGVYEHYDVSDEWQ